MDNAFEKRKAESILLLSCFPFLWVIKKNETNEKDNIYKLQGHLTNLIIVYFIPVSYTHLTLPTSDLV